MTVYQLYSNPISEMCLYCRSTDDPQEKAVWVAHENEEEELVHPMHRECATELFKGATYLHYCPACRVPVSPAGEGSDLLIDRSIVRINDSSIEKIVIHSVCAVVLSLFSAMLEYKDFGTLSVTSLLIATPVVSGMLVAQEVVGAMFGEKRDGMIFLAGVVTLLAAGLFVGCRPEYALATSMLVVPLGLHLLTWTCDTFSASNASRITTFVMTVFSAASFFMMRGFSQEFEYFGAGLAAMGLMVPATLVSRGVEMLGRGMIAVAAR